MTFISDALSSLFMFVGAAFSLIAALGIFRMPDLFTRMQVAAKTGTMGVGCTIIAVAIYFADIGVTIRATLIVLFLFLTAPIAAHMIARAGYIAGVRLWKHSVCDEMEGKYDRITHELSGVDRSDSGANNGSSA